MRCAHATRGEAYCARAGPERTPRVVREAGRPTVGSPSVAAARAALPMSASSAGSRSTAFRSTSPPEPAWVDSSAVPTRPAWIRMSCRRSSRPWTGISCSVRRRSPTRTSGARPTPEPIRRGSNSVSSAGSCRQPPLTADRTSSCCSAASPHRTSTSRISTTCRRHSERSPWISCRLSRSSCAAGRWPMPCGPRCLCRSSFRRPRSTGRCSSTAVRWTTCRQTS